MVKNTFRLALPVSIAAIVAFSGCAATRDVREIERGGQAVSVGNYDAARTPRKESRSFIVDSGFHAARTPISVVPVNPTVQLPASFFTQANINVQSPIAITEIGSRITKITGVPVTVDQDVLSSRTRASSARPSATPIAPPTALPAGPLPGDPSAPPTSLPPLPVSVELSEAPSETVLQDLVYRGNLAGLLDEVTGRLNLSWRWTGSRIEIFRYETKMFRLNSLAGKVSSDSNLSTTSSTSQGSGSSSGGGDSGNTGSSGSNISMSNEMEIWEEVEESLKEMLSADGKLTIAPSAGLISVRDTPAVLRQVESQIGEFNRIYAKQVTLHVEVYAVERQRGDNYSINWNALWSSASNALGFSFNAAGGTTAGPAFTIDVTDPNSPFAGSSVVGRALSTIGNTSLLTSGTVISLNGQTVPLNVSREQAYLQSSSTNFNGSDNGLATTTLTPGVATEGFSMNFTPRILDNNQVLVRYSIDLSVIEDIETFTAPGGSSAIQLPRRSVRNFLQNVSVPSGNSLVLTGFQQAQGTRNGDGPFSANAWFLGGSKAAAMTSRTIVIVVTPYVSQN